MRTPAMYTKNLKNHVITTQMLLDCLFSVNKRAKNYRDQERKYRHMRYDYYDNEEKNRSKKEEYYRKKDLMLSIIEPVCIHREVFERSWRERIYDYDDEYWQYYEQGGFVHTGGYWDNIEADLKIARDLISYADAFEYVYLDENNKIRSKIIKNTDAYPLYDAEGKYYCFVENWTDSDTRLSYSNVYYPDRVEIYKGRELVDTKENLTGLPIWYSSLDKTKYDNFGDPFLLDLIPIMDSVENLLSKLDDAVTTLSMNPFGVVSGQRIKSEIPKDIVGVTLNLEDGGSFNYANATMDKDSIKLELDYLIQQFYAVACVPSSILGQSNVANVSETSITMLYQQTSNFNRQFITEMTKGFMQRMEYIRKLMEIQGQTVTDEVFDSINFLFNVSKPVDNEANMNNMKIQYDCGAISKQTIIDKSPYTTDTALELQRLQDEAKVSQEIEELTPVPDTKTEEIVIDDENN